MPKLTAAKKAHKRSKKRALLNKIFKTRVKTCNKRVKNYIRLKNFKKAEHALKVAKSAIMRAVSKKMLKLNSASRRISRLTYQLKKH